MPFIVLILTAVAFLIYGTSIYNGLIRARNLIKNSFSQIDVQLKRRYDLIPNLVETAKAYMKHERDTLETVIRARNTAQALSQTVSNNPTDSTHMKQFMAAESVLKESMGRLMVTFEAYPELKANETMSQLMEELTSTENKISFARQAFNDAVLIYNNLRETFPNSIVANTFHFDSASGFELVELNQKETPQVKF